MRVTEISCTIAPAVLSDLLSGNRVARFSETGCLAGKARADNGFIGIGPNDFIDLLIEKGTPVEDAAQQILHWAQAWEEERVARATERYACI